MKSGLLRKLLLFLVLTLVVNALLTAGVFTYTSRNIFANMQKGEMLPRAYAVSEIVSQFQRGEISPIAFERLINMNLGRFMRDASVHIYLGDDSWITSASSMEGERYIERLKGFLPDLMGGSMAALSTVSKDLGILVAAPVYGMDAAVTGVVFLSTPLRDVNASLQGLNIALIISIMLAFAVMILPAFFGSRTFTRPLLHMAGAAQAMAMGDFTVRAEENRKDEIGVLGKSLNELSAALSFTIGDLMLEKSRLQNVLDGLHEGIVAVDGAGNVTHCNPAAMRLLGSEQTAAGALGRLYALWPEFDKETDGGALRAHMAVVSEAQLLLTVTEIAAQGGERAGVVALIQDVTEEVRLEQTRRDYVANVSHELRTPLASIRSLADALNDGLVKRDEDKMRYYGYILRESMRLSRLIDDLLELSRLQSGGVALQKRAFDLNKSLCEIAERFGSIAEESGLAFRLDTPPGELLVLSNEDRVEQVLVALLDNAVKYAADEGTVLLCAQSRENDVLVSVGNTGSIDETQLQHVFERFYKADMAHAEQGTGLGLAITQEIITLLGETIWAENSEGNVCFRFTLHK